MKNMLRVAVLFVALLAVGSVQAQKFGYVNSAEILANLPKVKQADANIESFQKVLEKQYQQMVEGFQKKYATVQQDVAAGKLSPQQQETEAEVLRTEETKISKFEQESQQKLLKKREDLLQPILDEVNNAIQAVAKEKGLQMIFDANVLLFKDPALDQSAAVKAKLGL